MTRPVVAGTDFSPSGQAAAEYAAALAARRARLHIAHAYWAEPWLDTTEADRLYAEAEQVAAQGVSYVRDRYPLLTVEGQAIRNIKPDEALIEASREAGLITVGCRGRGGFAGMLLGSVSRTIVHHAYCPVAVVHPAEH